MEWTEAQWDRVVSAAARSGRPAGACGHSPRRAHAVGAAMQRSIGRQEHGRRGPAGGDGGQDDGPGVPGVAAGRRPMPEPRPASRRSSRCALDAPWDAVCPFRSPASASPERTHDRLGKGRPDPTGADRGRHLTVLARGEARARLPSPLLASPPRLIAARQAPPPAGPGRATRGRARARDTRASRAGRVRPARRYCTIRTSGAARPWSSTSSGRSGSR